LQLVTLLHELRRRNGNYGLATLCVGGAGSCSGRKEVIIEDRKGRLDGKIALVTGGSRE